ncbi:MAG: penicillin acylase family protein [Planctomycetota bacterium]
MESALRILRARAAARVGLAALALAPSAAAVRGAPSADPRDPYPDLYDVVWDSPSGDAHGSMPLGNGDIGVNVWAEPDGEIAFLVGKTDSWDEHARLVKVGGFRIRIDPNPLAGKPFSERLRLRDATVDISAGEGPRRASARIWVDANSPAICVEIETAEPSEATASIELWRTERRELEALEVSDVLLQRGVPRDRRAPVVLEPDAILRDQAARIGWYHHNARSVGLEDLAKVQGLAGFPLPDPIRGRTFGAAILAPGGERPDDRTLRSARGASHRFEVFVLTRHPSTPESWLTAMDTAIRDVQATSFEDRRRAHEAWWRAFWARSWICATERPGECPLAIVPANAHPVRIGVDQGGENRFAGEIGRVSIVSRALSGAEVAALAGLGPEEAAPRTLGALFSGRPRELPAAIPDSEAWRFEDGLAVEAWVRPEALPPGGARIVDKIAPGGDDGFLLDTHPGNGARWIVGPVVLRKEGAAPAGKWTHLAGVADPATGAARLYVDGVRAAEELASDFGDEAFNVSRAYHLQRFLNACAGRGAHPIKFNGSIFTVPAPGKSDPDYRRWGPGYWWQNTRLPYYGMCASGDFDLLRPLFRMYAEELLDLAKYRTKLYCGHEGAFYPECIYFWGSIFSETYGWTPFEERADKLQESRWHKWEWVGGLELSWLMLEYYEYTLDAEFLERTAIPFAREILTFFERHYGTDASGKLVFHPAQALETWWDCTNPMPEVAGCHAVAERLLALPEDSVPAADRGLWRRLLEKLPPLPLRDVDGKKALAPAERFAEKRNVENPELYAVFPFRLVALGRPNLERGLEALRHRWDRGNSGWRQDDIFLAYLGLAEEARAYVVGRAQNHDPNSRFPAFWGPNYDWVPDQDHGSVLVKAFQSMLLQTDGRRILLLPAWPRSWDVRFQLRAPFRTTIRGEYREGKLVSLEVEPKDRRADVEILLPGGRAEAPAGAKGSRTAIVRDEWGVPRISGDSMAAVAYALGYAQAEDRLEEILKAYLRAEGRLASAFGSEFLEEDYQARALRHAEVSRARYGELSPQSRAVIEAFVAGIAKYMDEHPEKVPAWGFRPEPPMVIALVRTAAWSWPVGQAFEDLGRALPRPPGSGSNQWAVSPERSALGCAALAIDPHVPLFGILRWYECHLHGGPLHAYGFAVPGTPIVALGHNDHLAWACTTGGPDTSDIYEVELNRPGGLRYRYDGAWRDVETREIEIPVREGGATRAVRRAVRRTHHGPIVREAGARAFAMKIPYEEEVRLAEEFLAFNLARSLADFRHALELDQFFPQNLMAADVDGNIFYIRTGRVPIRPPGVDPARPIDGGTSKTEWLGLRKQAELVQCLNPIQGFFQNCNIGPDTMMGDSPMTPEKYPPEVYNAPRGATNPRGRRAVELLAQSDRLDAAGAIAILLDTGVRGFEGWIAALESSAETLARENSEERARLAGPLETLQAWDGRMEVESEGATLFYAWKMALRELAPKLELEAAPGPEKLAKPEKLALARALLRAAAELERVESRNVLELPGALAERPGSPPDPPSLEEVEELARIVATPYKLGRPVLEPTRKEGDFDREAVDCPNGFRFRGRWHMTYVGFDGEGYRTGLAASDDLIRWERLGAVLEKGPAGAFDSHGAAGLSILGDDELFSGHEPYRVRGRAFRVSPGSGTNYFPYGK